MGYVIGPTWVIDNLRIASLPYHLDAFKQAATIAALGYTDEMELRVAQIKAERTRLHGAMASIDIEVWPSGSNFILFRPRVAHVKEIWQSMLNQGVLVRDCSSWAGLEGCLRVTVGTEEENSAFLAALGNAVGRNI